MCAVHEAAGWTVIKKRVKSFLKKRRLSRSIYAVRQGTHKGHFFVYISTVDDKHNFLVLPDNTTESVDVKEFEEGINKKIVDYIEKLPNNVYEICCAQYNESKAKDDINRLKQSAASSSVDRGKRKKKRKS
jgi:hypothetical protein